MLQLHIIHKSMYTWFRTWIYTVLQISSNHHRIHQNRSCTYIPYTAFTCTYIYMYIHLHVHLHVHVHLHYIHMYHTCIHYIKTYKVTWALPGVSQTESCSSSSDTGATCRCQAKWCHRDTVACHHWGGGWWSILQGHSGAVAMGT